MIKPGAVHWTQAARGIQHKLWADVADNVLPIQPTPYDRQVGTVSGIPY